VLPGDYTEKYADGQAAKQVKIFPWCFLLKNSLLK
jgi:hypothetical protein